MNGSRLPPAPASGSSLRGPQPRSLSSRPSQQNSQGTAPSNSAPRVQGQGMVRGVRPTSAVGTAAAGIRLPSNVNARLAPPSSQSVRSGPTRAMSSTAPAGRKPSQYLLGQSEFQAQQKCDYVIVVYAKDDRHQQEQAKPSREGVDGEGPSVNKKPLPPQYVIKQTFPVKLSHQIFMQLSFCILRDRLKNYFVPSATRGSQQLPPPKASFEQDLCAMYLFLVRFVSEMERVKAEVEGRGRRRASARAALESVATKITTQHIRFQLLLEYGLDVLPILGSNSGPGSMEAYWRDTLSAGPSEVTEDEFYAQMGKASGMAQDCSIM